MTDKTTLPINHRRAADTMQAKIAEIREFRIEKSHGADDATDADAIGTGEIQLLPAGDFVGVGYLKPDLALDLIVESPKNPRRHFDEQRLEELVESIKQRGLLEPVVVRPAWRGDREVFELAAGHRRTRAAHRAGLRHVPAIVRVMEDGEFLEMLTISNLQREDVSPIEEAEGYQVLLADGGYDVASLALKLGKSESYVYGRLKLRALDVAVREALARDFVSLAQATELGKVDHAAQQEALRVLWNLDPKKLEAAATALAEDADGTHPAPVASDEEALWDDEDPGAAPKVSAALQHEAAAELAFTCKAYLGINRVNVAELREHLVANVYVQLSRAPFDRQDATLVPTAGACTACPKRSGITQSLFPELGGEDVCLDRACYHAKVLAHLDGVVAAERIRHPGVGVVRISSEYGRVPRGVLKPGMYKAKCPAVGEAPTKKARIGVYIDGVARGMAVWIQVADELVEKALAGKAVKATPAATGGTGPANYDQARQARDAAAERDRRRVGLEAVCARVLTELEAPSFDALAALRLVLSIHTVESYGGAPDVLAKVLPEYTDGSVSARQATLLQAIARADLPTLLRIGAVTIVGESWEDSYSKKLPESVVFLSGQLGLDGAEIAREAERHAMAAEKAQARAAAKAAKADAKTSPPAETAATTTRAAKRAKTVA